MAAVNGTNTVLEIWHESIVVDCWMDIGGWCQVRVFSGSKSGRIPDQGGEDGRADVGLGRE